MRLEKLNVYVFGQQKHVKLLRVVFGMEKCLLLHGTQELRLRHFLRFGIITMTENNLILLSWRGSCRWGWRGRRSLLLDEVLLHLHHVPELDGGPICAQK